MINVEICQKNGRVKMEKYIILADVTCDLSKEIRDYFKIEDYIEGFATFSDGRDIKTRLDWSLISREEFYKTLSSNKITSIIYLLPRA